MIDTALIFATACDFGWRVNSNLFVWCRLLLHCIGNAGVVI